MALPGSRGFLLVLLLVTLTCILLVQVSMDGWMRNGAFSNLKKRKDDENTLPSKTLLVRKGNITTPVSAEQEFHSASKSVFEKQLAINGGVERLHRAIGNYTQSIQVKTKVGNVRGVVSRSKKTQLREAHLKQIMSGRVSLASTRHSALKILQKLPIVDPTNVTNVLLLAYFRSGSSFTGELLQQNWKTFYQFEPLHYITYDSRIPDNRTQEAFSLLRSIYTCNFTGQQEYFQWVKHLRNQFLFSRSMFLWFYCRIQPRLCFYPEFVSAVCQRAPVRLSKVTRINMRQLKTFIDMNTDLNLKVVFLVRDPRGILSSRWSLDWCNGTDCSDPNFLCEEMANDIQIFDQMAKENPSKFTMVRYENMALNTTDVSRGLFKFLNLPFPRSLNRFLKSHTTARTSDDRDRYSTRRNSSSVAFSWRHRLSYIQVTAVQNSCHDVLNKLDYTIVSDNNSINLGNLPQQRTLQTDTHI